MGKRLASKVATTVPRLCGQVLTGPSAVAVQSTARSAASALPGPPNSASIASISPGGFGGAPPASRLTIVGPNSCRGSTKSAAPNPTALRGMSGYAAEFSRGQ
jgi:hypothetical protein